MFACNCRVRVSGKRHIISFGLWLTGICSASLKISSLSLLLCTRCTVPEYPGWLGFPLCRAYAARMPRTQMWSRDTDVTTLFASCGFVVECFWTWWAALLAVGCLLSPCFHPTTVFDCLLDPVGAGSLCASEKQQLPGKDYNLFMDLKSGTVHRLEDERKKENKSEKSLSGYCFICVRRRELFVECRRSETPLRLIIYCIWMFFIYREVHRTICKLRTIRWMDRCI